MVTHFRIVEWDQYQHYRHRDPPWIKLHRKILASRTWVMLDDASKALAVSCMLLAAGCENKIPYDPAYIKRAGYLQKDPDLTVLEKVGFIEIIGKKPNRASKRYQMQANACQSRVELETETDNRADTPPISPPAGGRAAKGHRIPENWWPSESDIAFAVDRGWTMAEIQDEAEGFVDFWLAATRNATKLDWSRAFKGRIREEDKRRPRMNGRHAKPPAAARDREAEDRQAVANVIQQRREKRNAANGYH